MKKIGFLLGLFNLVFLSCGCSKDKGNDYEPFTNSEEFYTYMNIYINVNKDGKDATNELLEKINLYGYKSKENKKQEIQEINGKTYIHFYAEAPDRREMSAPIEYMDGDKKIREIFGESNMKLMIDKEGYEMRCMFSERGVPKCWGGTSFSLRKIEIGGNLVKCSKIDDDFGVYLNFEYKDGKYKVVE